MTTPSPFLPNTRFFPEDPKLLQREMMLSYSDIANSLNAKDIGVYTTQETATGQQFYSLAGNGFRATLRKVFTATSILNGTTSIAHGMTFTSTTQFTRIYGTASRPTTSFLPLPYVNASTPADSIGLRVTNTNIEIIATTANWTAYSALVVIEYIPS